VTSSKSTAALIDNLVVDGKFQQSVFDVLAAKPRAVPALRAAVISHPVEEVRHACAELLRDAENTSAIPELIEALKDESPHVRFDALAALERILKVDLRWWLRVEAYYSKPGTMHKRVMGWWRRNKCDVWW
jgi:HEAT repeat protein